MRWPRRQCKHGKQPDIFGGSAHPGRKPRVCLPFEGDTALDDPKKNNAQADARRGEPAPEPELELEPAPPSLSDTERKLRAQLAAVSGGLAPDDYVSAWWDWYLNL